MTIEQCDSLAAQLLDYADSQGSDDASSYTYSYSRWNQSSTNGTWRGWFNPAALRQDLRKTYNRKGVYVTRGDVNQIFNIGFRHGLSKVCGWRAKYDSGFSAAIDGYPLGSILRTDDGIRMVSRVGNNKTALPENGETTSQWGKIDATPKFFNEKIDYACIDTLDFRFRGSIDLSSFMRTTTDKKMIGSVYMAVNGFIMIPYRYQAQKYYRYTTQEKAEKSWSQFFSLCKEGEMRLFISPYDDVYTNPEHEGKYVEVLHSWTVKISNYQNIIKNAQMRLLPLTKGTYYLYMEMNQGSIQFENDYLNDRYREWNDYKTCRLGFNLIYRRLDWPQV